MSNNSAFNSLKPDAGLVEAAADGHPVAIAVVESWRFSIPIIQIPSNDPIWQREMTFND